jgi:hypothetical protein
MRTYWCVIAGFLAGAVLWNSSEVLTGKVQPWDAVTVAYLGALFLCGVLLGLVDARNFWAGPLGAYLGQALIIASHGLPRAPTQQPIHPVLVPLFLFTYSLPCFVGAAVAAAAVRWSKVP